MKPREKAYARFHHLYTYEGCAGDPCVYCGVEASGVDHVPPLHFIGRIPPQLIQTYRLRLLPSCAQCNSILGGELLVGLDERRVYVKGRLLKKYARILRIPKWDEADFADLSERLTQDVRDHLEFANHVRARLSFWGELRTRKEAA